MLDQNGPKDRKNEFPKRTASRRDADLKKNDFLTMKKTQGSLIGSHQNRIPEGINQFAERTAPRRDGDLKKKRARRLDETRGPNCNTGFGLGKTHVEIEKTHGASTRRREMEEIMVSVPNNNYL